MAFLDTVTAVTSDRDNDRALITGVLLSIWASTHVLRYALPRMFPRVRIIPRERQQQLFMLIPIMVLRCGVGLLVAEAEFSSRLRTPGSPKTIDLLNHQFNLFFYLCIGYLFELICRPSPIELDMHHLVTIATMYKYLFLNQTSTATLDLFQVGIIMIIWGIAPVDFASETMRFIYYAIEPNMWSSAAMYGCAVLAWVARIIQWVVMIGHLGECFWRMLEAWGKVEMAVAAAFAAFWIRMEWVEIVHLVRLAKKYSARMQKLSHH